MRLLALAFVAVIPAATYAADTTTWTSDKIHSSVGFSTRYLLVSEVSGEFTDYEVDVISTKEDFSDAQITVTVNTTSIDTDNEKRDNHLRSDDFFNAEKYPVMKFVGKKLGKLEGNRYKLHGDLTIRDITKPITLDATFGGFTKDPWGNERAGFKIWGEVNRFEYGLKWDATTEAGGLVVGPTVKIESDLSLVKQK
jgi:polyisoprenoid-binding protein YceI